MFSLPFVCFLALGLYFTPWHAFKEPATNSPFDDFERKDDIWPLRPQTPWDISTDFPYPRTLEYTVEEGTWLRLDVHPRTGDIVFDMAGDLYCISGAEYQQHSPLVSIARSFLRGVPHDADPHFSPEGDRVAFRSDAGLGIENIWVMKWRGCEEMDLDSSADSQLVEAHALEDEDRQLLLVGKVESEQRNRRRLLREGRLGGTSIYLCLRRGDIDP